jgi:hypothetical protein
MVDPQEATARELGYMLWALTHGLVSLELSHTSRSPLAHPALAGPTGRTSSTRRCGPRCRAGTERHVDRRSRLEASDDL